MPIITHAPARPLDTSPVISTPSVSWYESAGPPRRRGGNFAPQTWTCSSSFEEAQLTGRPAVMETIGLDLHKRESQLCILAEDGTLVERRIVTSRERFTAVLA